MRNRLGLLVLAASFLGGTPLTAGAQLGTIDVNKVGSNAVSSRPVAAHRGIIMENSGTTIFHGAPAAATAVTGGGRTVFHGTPGAYGSSGATGPGAPSGPPSGAGG